MYMFCFLFTIFPSYDFGRTKEIIYEIVVGPTKDPLRVYPGGRGMLPYISYIGMYRPVG